jgi:hypothetical protein
MISEPPSRSVFGLAPLSPSEGGRPERMSTKKLEAWTISGGPLRQFGLPVGTLELTRGRLFPDLDALCADIRNMPF